MKQFSEAFWASLLPHADVAAFLAAFAVLALLFAVIERVERK